MTKTTSVSSAEIAQPKMTYSPLAKSGLPHEFAGVDPYDPEYWTLQRRILEAIDYERKRTIQP